MAIDNHDEEDADESEQDRLRDQINVETEKTDRILADLLSQPMPDLTVDAEETDRILAELLSQPMPDLTMDTEAINRLLHEMTSQPMPDLTMDTEVLNSILADAEPLPPPDPNLTASDVANWMRQEVQAHGTLYQNHAASYIWRHFGSRFLREHENSRIAPDVLNEFLKLTKDTVVWNLRERFWRVRQPGDPPGRQLPS